MFPTVPNPDLRQDRSNEKEKIDLPNALKRAANMTSRTRRTLTTPANHTYETLWQTDDIPEGAVWTVEAFTVFRSTSGPSQAGRFWETAVFYRNVGGTIIEIGRDNLAPPLVSSGFFSTQFFLDGLKNSIFFLVRDDGASVTDWDTTFEMREVT